MDREGKEVLERGENGEKEGEGIEAPNDTAYKRWSCHSGFKSNLPAPCNGGPIYRFLGMPAMRTRWMAGAAAHKSG